MLGWLASFVPRVSPKVLRSLQGASLVRVSGFWMCALLLGGTLAVSPFVRAQEAESKTQSANTPDRPYSTIESGDLLDLSVYHVPELLVKVRVDSNGVVSLPLIGDLKLAGLSVRDAQLLIAHELVERQLINMPQVSLFVEELATQGITVFGEVNAPGIYPLTRPPKLYDAISAAGGLTVKAGNTITVLHGGQSGREEIVDLSGEHALEKSNVTISSGDTVIVSKAGVVYVLGEVNKPGAFLMENNTSVSLMKAIAMAGSTTKIASLKHAIVIRKSAEGTVEIDVSLDKIYHAKSADMQLRAEDIVFVPLSNWKSYGAMGIQGAIQAAVYTVYAAELHN